jgi:hypothetical protein
MRKLEKMWNSLVRHLIVNRKLKQEPEEDILPNQWVVIGILAFSVTRLFLRK